ncbi:MAG: YraN family protein [Flavobacteriaceae bacterium]|jgi:putative endonuclease|nr:YraN family protein [Flavobacteriaceae bacterium]
MAIHNDFGKEAEKKAMEFLLSAGYEILETNWRYQKSEIDIIAAKDNRLIIIEVKARSYDDVLSPEEAVNHKKKKLLILAADAYVTQNDWEVDVRFDIISILKQDNKWIISHIEDAFNSVS